MASIVTTPEAIDPKGLSAPVVPRGSEGWARTTSRLTGWLPKRRVQSQPQQLDRPGTQRGPTRSPLAWMLGTPRRAQLSVTQRRTCQGG